MDWFFLYAFERLQFTSKNGKSRPATGQLLPQGE
jgi:hypothetical protein